MRELFLGKIIDLILSLGIFFFFFYSEHKDIVLGKKRQAQNVLEAKNG